MTSTLLTRRWPALLCSLSLLLLTDAKATSYDALILRAREGDTRELMTYFADRSAHHSLSSSQIADWLQVASWQQDNNTVLAVWQRYKSQPELPARAFAAVASAQRNQQRWPEAIEHWRQAVKLDPQAIDYLSSLSMTEADASEFTAAAEAIVQIYRLGKPLDYQLALAYLLLREQKPSEALFILTQAAQRAPADQRVQQQLTELYSINRLSRPALDAEHSLSLSAQVVREKQLDYAAGVVRDALIQTDNPQSRFETADRALAFYQKLCRQWRGLPEAQQLLGRLRNDRLGALAAREYYDEVIEEYHRLSHAKQSLPGYVKTLGCNRLVGA